MVSRLDPERASERARERSDPTIFITGINICPSRIPFPLEPAIETKVLLSIVTRWQKKICLLWLIQICPFKQILLKSIGNIRFVQQTIQFSFGKRNFICIKEPPFSTQTSKNGKKSFRGIKLGTKNFVLFAGQHFKSFFSSLTKDPGNASAFRRAGLLLVLLNCGFEQTLKSSHYQRAGTITVSIIFFKARIQLHVFHKNMFTNVVFKKNPGDVRR